MPEDTARYRALRANLEQRQRELREETKNQPEDLGFNQTSSPEFDLHSDIERALFEMKTEILLKFNDARVRLEAGTYGQCHECGNEIEEKRLHSLPLAIRCGKCQHDHEVAERRARSAKKLR